MVEKNKVLIHDGDIGDKFYIILEGTALVYTTKEKEEIKSELEDEKAIINDINNLKNII